MRYARIILMSLFVQDMIEVVSPARTLRFKGETTVEHRLWSDSLHRLCNPPKAAPPKQEATPPVADHKARDRRPSERESIPADTRAANIEAAAAQVRANEARGREEEARLARVEREKLKEQTDSIHKKRSDSFDRRRRRSSHSSSASDRSNGSDDDHSPRTGRRNSLDRAPSPRESDRPSSREQQRNLSSESLGTDREHHSCGSTPRLEDDGLERNDRKSPPRSQRQCSSEHNSDDSDSEDDRETKPVIGNSDPCRPSLLVAQIKATSARNVSVAEPKSSRAQTAAKREGDLPVATKAPVEAKEDEEEQQRTTTLAHAPIAKSSAQHLDDSEDDDPEQETPRDESAHEPVDSTLIHTSTVAERVQQKSVKQTEYFDSDEEHEEQDNRHRPQPSKATSNSRLEPAKASPVATDGIARDNNFVEEDWDAEDELPSMMKKDLPMNKSPDTVRRFGPLFFAGN